MEDLQGMPGTYGSLFLRVAQAACAIVSLCVMITTEDFSSISALCYLVAAVGLQSSWSLSMAAIDIHMLLLRRSLQSPSVIKFYVVSDLVTSTLTYCFAAATFYVKVLLCSDLQAYTKAYCMRLDAAATLAFLSGFFTLPSFLLNFWSLGSRF